MYVRSKVRSAALCGFRSHTHELPTDAKEDEVVDLVARFRPRHARATADAAPYRHDASH
ncbi:hypothetical protein EN786_30780 [Mesorhizobium sp. M4B.F.Ca.ET.143.01.1.1]|nr:hypothetical protein EN786_30780 [Mesorhizobium sp. M4B.F.Ca.ET.143.01.1.1]